MKHILLDGSVIEEGGSGQPVYGTSLVGHVDASYKTLVHLFGEPSAGDGEKTDAKWVIGTPDGIAVIYNYQDGQTYLGSAGKPTELIRDWHIGGRDRNVAKWVCNVVSTDTKEPPEKMQRSVTMNITYQPHRTQDVLRIIELLSSVADVSRREPEISIDIHSAIATGVYRVAG